MTRYLLALVAATAVISLTDWLFFGVLFHDRYQRTPEVWRTGSEGRKIALSMVFAAVGVAAFLCLALQIPVQGFSQSLLLALLVWLAASLPQTATATLYVRYDVSLGASHALGYLARTIVAAAAYTWIIAR
ncbi:MAG TPA: hypothetical protein VIG78_01010 [Gemmatimonadaceae bacterium]|jgi:hypothetical protein